jgi:hypothetical protein
MRLFLITTFLMVLLGGAAAWAQDVESTLVFSHAGKGYSDGDTVDLGAGEEMAVKVKVFIKEFKVKGGRWKKNSKGQWRYYNNIRGYEVGLGIGNMSFNILKEEYLWRLKGDTPKCIGTSQELKWKVPDTPGNTCDLEVTTKTEGQVKTEGSASMHGIHIDYNVPGGGKRTFEGKGCLHIHVIAKKTGKETGKETVKETGKKTGGNKINGPSHK